MANSKHHSISMTLGPLIHWVEIIERASRVSIQSPIRVVPLTAAPTQPVARVRSLELPFKYELQPLMHVVSGDTYGYELLYRGDPTVSWKHVDRQILDHLVRHKGHTPRMFVNLSNETLLEQPFELIIEAASNNDVIFEVSEAMVDAQQLPVLTERINTLIASGVRFAIDDFGNGMDGMMRFYSLAGCKSVKFDGAFLKVACQRPDAVRVLRSLVKMWKEFDIVTIAEWIENAEMLAFAVDLGVDLVQGWHIDSLVAKQRSA